jgi:hypothetical protein
MEDFDRKAERAKAVARPRHTEQNRIKVAHDEVQLWIWRLPSKPFRVHHSPVTLPFNNTQFSAQKRAYVILDRAASHRKQTATCNLSHCCAERRAVAPGNIALLQSCVVSTDEDLMAHIIRINCFPLARRKIIIKKELVIQI